MSDNKVKMNWKMYYTIDNIVLQPTTFCNMDCKYCYLPLRGKNIRMKVEVAEAIAASLDRLDIDQIVITWHCGEPLATGLEYFASLLNPFKNLVAEKKVLHVIQTNATIINEDWCKFIIDNQIYVSLSIDGNEELNNRRIFKNGKQAYKRILRGIELLKKHNITFSIISVVSDEALSKGKELYNYLADFDCEYVAFNIEEALGVNKTGNISDNAVLEFWTDLFREYKNNPRVQVREFRRILSWLRSFTKEEKIDILKRKTDFIPTINANGEVVVLSPEFLDVSSERYNDFIVGNVLRQSLDEILEAALSKSYVQDFLVGRVNCANNCDYFYSCGGGCAANKYFENGDLTTMETNYCRHSEKLLTDAILNEI